MKKTGIIKLICLLAVAGNLSAQDTLDAELIAWQGKASITRVVTELKLRKGLALANDDVAAAYDGTILIRFTESGYFGCIHESARKVVAAPLRVIMPEILKRITDGSVGLYDGFLQGEQLPGYLGYKRTIYLNFIIVVDISGSMEDFFEEIRAYINEIILRQLLVSKDYLYLYTFAGSTEDILAATIDLPGDYDQVGAKILALEADGSYTDIGRALETLDRRLARTFPHRKTIVFFITDGEHKPPPTSPYNGVNIYADGAFDAYEVLKQGDYKVMVLSIGAQTAGRELVGPLGGEYIEVTSDLTAEALNKLLSDFINDIELIVPSNIGRIRKRTTEMKVAFLSSYSTPKTVNILEATISVEDGPEIPLVEYEAEFEIGANHQSIKTLTIRLPKTVAKGRHRIQLSLATENNIVTKPVQEFDCVYAPIPFFAIIIPAVLFLAGVTALVLILLLRRRRQEVYAPKEPPMEKLAAKPAVKAETKPKVKPVIEPKKPPQKTFHKQPKPKIKLTDL